MYELPGLRERGVIEEALLQPVPNMAEHRERKKGYADVPIDRNNPLYSEPVVDVSEYAIAGQAYYSRPNAATEIAITELKPSLFLRKSVAETLAVINSALAQQVISDFFGGEVELYLEDALRPVPLQRRLHDELIPALLHKNHPEMSEEQIQNRVSDIIAIPSSDPDKPSPHSTGGAFDIILRYKQSTPTFVDGVNVPVGHVDGETSSRINPDYFEHSELRSEGDKLAQRNRRAYYAILTGKLFGVDTGLVNNPTEWWHWGRGDQLSAKVHGDETAYYSSVNM